MATLEYGLIQALTERLDALDTAATSVGARDFDELLEWLLPLLPFTGQANFENANASGLVAAI